jgi:hypothetical protein
VRRVRAELRPELRPELRGEAERGPPAPARGEAERADVLGFKPDELRLGDALGFKLGELRLGDAARGEAERADALGFKLGELRPGDALGFKLGELRLGDAARGERGEIRLELRPELRVEIRLELRVDLPDPRGEAERGPPAPARVEITGFCTSIEPTAPEIPLEFAIFPAFLHHSCLRLLLVLGEAGRYIFVLQIKNITINIF